MKSWIEIEEILKYESDSCTSKILAKKQETLEI